MRLHRVSVLVLAFGLVLTVVVAITAADVDARNENRLLQQRAHEVARVASAALPNVEAPLSTAAEVAEGSGGDPTAFRQLMLPIIDAGRPFISASVWAAHSNAPRPLAVVGAKPMLATRPRAQIQAFLQSARLPAVAVENLLDSPERRLGYGYSAARPNPRFVVYAEAAIPRNRHARIASDRAFHDLDYAIYLGRVPHRATLLASSRPGGALEGPRLRSEVVPFGRASLLLVTSARGELGGRLLARLPWLLAGVGAVLSLGAALLVERLARRRDAAEGLAALLGETADQNARLYADQRTIAQTLQHSLVPERLPGVPGVVAAGRYVAAVSGLEVGGDWYDVVPVGPHRLLFSVGDVCGRGLVAAATMASLRYAIRAYAVEGDLPSEILDKLARLLPLGRPDEFATVACGIVDSERRELLAASAGHLDFLLLDASDARFVRAPVGTPLGVAARAPYEAKTIPLPDEGTLLAFTNGLVERRGESLDVGLLRLQERARSSTEPVDALVDRIVGEVAPNGTHGDIAVLAVRWLFARDAVTVA